MLGMSGPRAEPTADSMEEASALASKVGILAGRMLGM